MNPKLSNLRNIKNNFLKDTVITQLPTLLFEENENLYTAGGEFLEEIKTPGYPTVRKDYKGYYHIHPDKGPMVGRQHVDAPHNYLIPIPTEIKKYEKREQMIEDTSSNTQQSAPLPSSGGYGGY